MNEELKNILEKVLVLYSKYGIKSITMDDVARELGISKKTLYQYVCDKTDLVARVVELDIEQRKCDFDKAYDVNKNAIEELIDVQRFVFKKMKEQNPSTDYDLRKYYPDIYKKYNDDRHKKIYEHVIANLKRGKEQGLYRNELNEEIITTLTVMRSDVSMSLDTLEKIEFTSPEFFSEIMIYHIRGIANATGLEILEQHIDKLKHTTKE